MEIIKTGDSRVAKIINRKKLSETAQYRLSLFTYLYSENSRYLICNTLTSEIAELTEQEWDAVQQLKNTLVGYDFITENGLEQLAMSRYIVESDYDDIAKYQSVCFLLKTMAVLRSDPSCLHRVRY